LFLKAAGFQCRTGISAERIITRHRATTLLQIAFFKARHFEQMPQQTDFQRLISVDGNRQPNNVAGFAIDVVTAVDSKKLPAVTFDHTGKVLASDGFHKAISSTLSLPVGCG